MLRCDFFSIVEVHCDLEEYIHFIAEHVTEKINQLNLLMKSFQPK